MIFKTPLILAAIPVVLLAFWLFQRRQRPVSIRFSSTDIFSQAKLSWRQRLLRLPAILRIIILVLFLAALAGPRSVLEFSEITTEGIDIVLAIDVSGSMAAEDFVLKGRRRNRLDVVKTVVQDFVKARRSDRIGLVAFAREAYTVSPLTADQDWLLNNLDRLRLGLIEDGTAVGSGLSSALVRLKESDAKSKIIILLTDGVNNAGTISPFEAAEIAQAMEVKVYTIGAGTRDTAPFPVKDIWGRTHYQQVKIEIDEEMLRSIARKTHAQYFRADDTESLREIYKAIDLLEKAEIKHYGYREYKELFPYVLALALFLLGIEVLLKNTVLFVLP